MFSGGGFYFDLIFFSLPEWQTRHTKHSLILKLLLPETIVLERTVAVFFPKDLFSPHQVKLRADS